MTGVMLIRAFLDKRDGEASKDRRVMLIPDSAHGTNPASAALAGFTVKTIKSTDEGLTDMEHLKSLCERRRNCRIDADESEHGRDFREKYQGNLRRHSRCGRAWFIWTARI